MSATGRSLVQRSPTECGVSECDLETSVRSRPTRAVVPWKRIYLPSLWWCSFRRNWVLSLPYWPYTILIHFSEQPPHIQFWKVAIRVWGFCVFPDCYRRDSHKRRKETVSFVISVLCCPKVTSVATLDGTARKWWLSKKSVEKLQYDWNRTNISGT
jgi:hypothetical protein